MSGGLLGHLIGFARSLRAAGVLVTPDQVVTFVRALEHVPLIEREAVRLTARATLVCRREDLPRFEALFARFWRMLAPEATARRLPGPEVHAPFEVVRAALSLAREGAAPVEGEQPVVDRTLSYSPSEVLRQRHFEACTPEELAHLERFVLGLSWQLAARTTRRKRRARAPGRPDVRRTLRRSLRCGGEWLELAYHRPLSRPRPLVVLLDISGSMERYARLLLLFTYGLARRTPQLLEAFVFGTRLTHVTLQLRTDNPEAALAAIGKVAKDWSGGTRIGAVLATFNRRYAKRALARGAVVLLVSDGWDRGDPQQLAREIAWLQRRCYRLIWLNPLLGNPGYAPLTRGMQAALPYLDDFLPLHNLKSLEELALHLERLPPRRPPRRTLSPLRAA